MRRFALTAVRLGVFLKLLILCFPAGAADVMRGAQVYRQYCATCHGMQGQSTWPGAPSFARNESLLQPDQRLLERIRAGRNAMPAYRGILSDQDILNVIAFSRTLIR